MNLGRIASQWAVLGGWAIASSGCSAPIDNQGVAIGGGGSAPIASSGGGGSGGTASGNGGADSGSSGGGTVAKGGSGGGVYAGPGGGVGGAGGISGAGGEGGTSSEAGAGGAGGDTAQGGGGGAAGAAGAGGAADPGIGPTSCLPLFMDACTPEINFSNEEPDGRGAMFDQVIPDPVTTMQDIACTVCSILFRDPNEIPENRRHETINLTIKDHTALASAGGNSINFDVKHIENYDDEDRALLEFQGVLVHETVHLYQNYGNGGLGEGMADFVRIRVALYEPGRRNSGGSWTDPYTTSGFFFSWLAGPGLYHDDGRDPHEVDIGYLINKTIGEDGPDGVPVLFMDTFGVDVDTLWDEYQTAIQ